MELDIKEHINVGKCKYVVSYYTGKKHPDGSNFYDIRIFKSKRIKNWFIKMLKEENSWENIIGVS